MSFSQIVTNGTFSSNSDWTNTAGAVIANGKLTVTVTGGGFERSQQTVVYHPGSIYKLTATVNGTAGKRARFRDALSDSGGLKIANGIVTFTGSDQKVELIWTTNANSTKVNIERQDTSGDYSFTVDNIIVSRFSPFNDIIKPADVPTPIFNDIIRTYAGEEPWQAK